MSEPAMILELDGVRSRPATHDQAGLDGVTLGVAASELVMIRVEEGGDSSLLCDVAQGLRPAERGRVLFRGESWLDMDDFRRADRRGRIGRAFAHGGWISNLGVLENVTLAARFHPSRYPSDLDGDVATLIQEVGLRELPTDRPEKVPRSIRRRAAWVRAFLGRPDLLLLDCPETGVEQEYVTHLMALAEGATKRQAGVVWMTRDAHTWSLGSPAATRLVLHGYELRGE